MQPVVVAVLMAGQTPLVRVVQVLVEMVVIVQTLALMPHQQIEGRAAVAVVMAQTVEMVRLA